MRASRAHVCAMPLAFEKCAAVCRRTFGSRQAMKHDTCGAILRPQTRRAQARRPALLP